ncbi:mitochondrial ribosomal protein L42 [Rhodnius prolixus]|uniref:Large ribosomal subunit protein mL42 n=2 Tax=Rhodnius TaxID=13248 RepID=T1H9Z6_RHOPR
MSLHSLFIKLSYNVVRIVRNANLPALQSYPCRNKHVGILNEIQDPIVVTNDGSTIVCWHPEKEFPYECTKPLPEQLEESSTSVLKNSEKNVYTVFAKKSLDTVPDELAKITYTTKHRWYPRNRDKRAKKTPRDRSYL